MVCRSIQQRPVLIHIKAHYLLPKYLFHTLAELNIIWRDEGDALSGLPGTGYMADMVLTKWEERSVLNVEHPPPYVTKIWYSDIGVRGRTQNLSTRSSKSARLPSLTQEALILATTTLLCG